jgi:hypothetical protein
MEAAALKELANYGVLGVFAVLAILAIWRLAKYFAPKFDELWKAMVGLVHEAKTTIGTVGENSRQLINISQTQAEASERIESQIIATGKTVDGHTFTLNSLGQRIDEHGETLEEIKSRLPK